MDSVCVLMSTYNGARYLKEQIDSILSQKGNFTLNILIRDDGSKDNTISILNSYSNEKRISWYSGDNLKSAKSFMDLIKNAGNYDYYAFSDQDDYWNDNKIQAAITKLSFEEKPSLYYSNPELVDANLNSLGRTVYKRNTHNDFYSIICGVSIIGCTVVINKRLFEILNSHTNPEVITMHDSYIARVCTAVNGKIIYDKNSYMKYRQHSQNVIGLKKGIFSIINHRIIKVFKKNKITLDEQISEIIRIYFNLIPKDKLEFLDIVSKYRKNLFYRLYIVFNIKTKYVSYNMSLRHRIAFLLGNR